MTLTKKDMADSLSRRLSLPKIKSEDLVASLFETMKETLASGEDLLITGFGKFCVKDKKKRRGRNPWTGEKLPLKARRVVAFQ